MTLDEGPIHESWRNGLISVAPEDAQRSERLRSKAMDSAGFMVMSRNGDGVRSRTVPLGRKAISWSAPTGAGNELPQSAP
jgi:hypothetical protein